MEGSGRQFPVRPGGDEGREHSACSGLYAKPPGPHPPDRTPSQDHPEVVAKRPERVRSM